MPVAATARYRLFKEEKRNSARDSMRRVRTVRAKHELSLNEEMQRFDQPLRAGNELHSAAVNWPFTAACLERK